MKHDTTIQTADRLDTMAAESTAVAGTAVGVAVGGGPRERSEQDSIDTGHEPMAELQDPWIFRAVQIALAGGALLVMSPVMLIVALAVRLLSPGPIFYRGERVGQGMRKFTILKFRTLRVGSEGEIGARLLNSSDNFYTPIGRFLKRSKLDELPQLWNIVRGDMNLVGPRPVRPIFLPEFLTTIPRYARRFQMKPGVTGLAQLRGGYFTSPASKLRYELWYLRNRRPMLDFMIIALTLFKILNRWITLGGLLLVLFIFVSFMPSKLLDGFYVYAFGVRASLVHIVIAAIGLWLIVRRQTEDSRIVVYRTPLAIPMAVFIALGLTSAALSDFQYQAVRGALYYLATGFLITSAIVNGTLTRRFIERALQVVALSAVLISVIGVVDLALTAGPQGDTLVTRWLAGPGITGTFGNPVVMATYLVLSVPALLYQLTTAPAGPRRDFWTATTTVTFIGILLTKSPAGMVGVSFATLLVVWRFFPQLLVPCLIVLAPFLYVAAEPTWETWQKALCGPGGELCQMLGGTSVSQFFFGIGPRTLGEYGIPASVLEPEAVSMHVRVLIENGVLGWLALVWVLGTALFVLYRAQREVRDENLRALLWAVFCSVAGFVVTLQGFSAFENLTLQVFFWGLLGIGIGAAVRFGPRRRDYAIVLKLGH